MIVFAQNFDMEGPTAVVATQASGFQRFHCSCQLAPRSLRGSAVKGKAFVTRKARTALRTVALVNVEFNPALLLGIGIMSSGVVLYQLRQSRTAISRDTDLFISCICLCSGGILVFQVWPLFRRAR